MKLSVIILNYNVRHFLELCLRSVERAIQDLDAEIIVVDNHSQDDSCSMVRSNFPGIHLIQNTENYGFAKGNNIGVSQAKGEYICILNPDTVVPEQLFMELLAFAENHPELGAAGCQLIDGSGQFLPESKRNVPTMKVALGKLTGSSEGYYADHIGQNENAKVDILVGAIMFMKKRIYEEAGGFDEDYFMYGEDIDLSYTLLKMGYENWYLGELKVLHFKGESTPKDNTYLKHFYGAMHTFYDKHFKPNLLFSIVVKLGTKVLALFRSKGPDPVLNLSEGLYIGKAMPDGLPEIAPKNFAEWII